MPRNILLSIVDRRPKRAKTRPLGLSSVRSNLLSISLMTVADLSRCLIVAGPHSTTYGKRPSRHLLMRLPTPAWSKSSHIAVPALDGLADRRRPRGFPRRLIHAEGDDSCFCFHSLSSLAWRRDRRL